MRKELLLKEKNQQLCKSLGDSNFGDVMVVGGGISGIQASLDLATAGFFDVTLAAEVFAIRTEPFLETLESGEDLFYGTGVVPEFAIAAIGLLYTFSFF